MQRGRKTWPYERRNMLGGYIHGIFIQLGMALSQDTTVLPAFMHALTGSDFLVGTLMSLKRVGVILPQLLFAHFLESKRFKRPYLIWVIYSRSALWFCLGFFTLFWGNAYPGITAGVLLFLLTLFFFAGGLGDVVYSYMIARTISPTSRGKFFGIRYFLGGLAGMLSGYISHRILAHVQPEWFAKNYALLFLLTAGSLALAGIGFLSMREPGDGDAISPRSLKSYLHDALEIVKANAVFRRYIAVTMLISGIYLVLPFLVIYAKVGLHVPASQIGIFITLQVIGEMSSGLFWGPVGDRYGYRIVLIGVSLAGFLMPVWAVFSGRFAPALFGLSFVLVGMGFRGADMAGRNYLLEITAENLVPTFIAIRNTLTAPTLLFPIIGGLLVNVIGYQTLFMVSAGIIGSGFLLSLTLPEPRRLNK